VSHNRHASFIR